MSNTNGQTSFVKSMNGILSFNTGSGIIIEGDSITAETINCTTLTATNFDTDNIQGITPTDAITLYTDTTNNISLGNSLGLGTLALRNKYVNIGSSGNTIGIILDSHTTTLSGSITNLNSTITTIAGTTTNINSPTTTITGTITNLNSTSTKVANTLSVTTIVANLITAAATIFNTTTTGSIGIGGALTSGVMYIGNHFTHTGNILVRTLGSLILGPNATTVIVGTTCNLITIGPSATAGTISIGNLAGPTTTNIYGSNFNVNCPSITMGSATSNTTIDGSTTNLHCDITDITGTTANLNSITTTIDGTDANLFSTNTTISGITANLNSNTITLAGTTTDLNSITTTIAGTTANLSSPNINLGSGISGNINTYGANLNVGTTNTFINSTGIIIGTVGSSTTIYGTLSIPGTLIMDNIQGTSPSSAVSLYGNTTTGTINMGDYASAIRIGINQPLQTDRIIIGNNFGLATMHLGSRVINIGLNAGSVQIGNYMLATGSGLSIGNNVVLTTINGSTLNAGLNATAINMGTTMTAGSIIMGNDTNTGELTLRTGGILALGNFAPTINIGSNQLLATDRVNIGNITGGLAGMNLGAKTINIGLISTSIQIGNNMPAGGVGLNIGNSSILTTIDGSTLNVGRYATALNMGTNMTTGSNINIGNTLVTTNLNGQTINMGNTMTTGNNISIGNNVVTTNLNGQTINMGNTMTTAGASVNIGTAGITSSVTLSGITVNMAAGFINIGNAATTINLGPANTTSGIVSKCPHTFNNGISFLNSNILRNKIIRGENTTTVAIPAHGVVTQTHFYPSSYTFGTAPSVVASIIGAGASIVMSVTYILTDRFVTVCRNITGVAIVANGYAIAYIAIGPI